MDIDWTAIVVGFVVSLALGLIGGATVPFTEVTLPALSSVLSGLVAGLAAGYVAGGDWGRGAIHGGLSVVIGALVVVVVLGVIGTLVAGLVGLGLFALGLFLLVLYAIPGAIGGAIGAALKRRSTAGEVARPVD